MSFKLNISVNDLNMVLGRDDNVLKILSTTFNTKVSRNNHSIIVKDKSKVAYIKSILFELIDKYNINNCPTSINILNESIEKYNIKNAKNDNSKIKSYSTYFIPKSNNQQKLYNALTDNIIVAAVASAGVGKSFVVTAKAVEMLTTGEVSQIVLVRPLVATEDIGYLPGTALAKISPYLIPLYEALDSMVGKHTRESWIKNETIRIIPLAFMRGVTFNDAVIILDEAQNTTPDQMKMCLSRIGENSKIFITGDLDQSDLKISKNNNISLTNGLESAISILDGVEGFELVQFNDDDVIRSDMCKRVVDAYKTSMI